MRWVRANRTALGLTAADVDDLSLSDRAVDRGSGFTYLRYRQSYRGIPAFDGGLRVNLDRGGRSKRLTVKLSSKAKRALKRHRRKSVKATLTVTVRDAGGRRRSARRTVTIKV